MNMKLLENRVVLITGAARRVGAVLARRLHEQGARVAIHYHQSETEAQQLVEALNAERPASAMNVRADLCQPAQIKALIEPLVDTWGRIDGLINNASTYYPTPLSTASLTQWDDLMATNLKAPFLLSLACFGQLKKHKGAIINLVDIQAEKPIPQHAIYCTAKAGLIALTKALAIDMAPEVRVNAVAPGPVLASQTGESINLENETYLSNKALLRPTATPDDVADAVLYLLASARATTGQVIRVDAGAHVAL